MTPVDMAMHGPACQRIAFAVCIRNLLILVFLCCARTAEDVDDGTYEEEYGVEIFAGDGPGRCAHLRNEAPEDTNSGFPTFVAARPSVVLDLSHCSSPAPTARVNFATHAGTRASAVFTQGGGWDAAAVIDGIASEAENGWAYLGRLEEAILTVRFAAGDGSYVQDSGEVAGDGNADNGGEAHVKQAAGVPAARVVIVSGCGFADHHLTSFRLWISSSERVEASEGVADTAASQEDDDVELMWTRIPGLASTHSDVVVGADGVSVSVKPGIGEVVLDFPAISIAALRIKVRGLVATVSVWSRLCACMYPVRIPHRVSRCAPHRV